MPGPKRIAGDGWFPPSSEALEYPNGLLCAGGDLSPQLLQQAYRRGIFPWYDDSQPILWWTPDPRSVIFPDQFHCSRSLRKTLRRNHFSLAVDTAFAQVMTLCGSLRTDAQGSGTWISPAMRAAYGQLHHLGLAHSVEVYDTDGALVGGLYGIAMGRAFFGESMFSTQTDASKVAMVGLVDILRRGDFALIDCQMETEHLNSLGARCISRLDFETALAQTVDQQTDSGIWHLPATCGDLL